MADEYINAAPVVGVRVACTHMAPALSRITVGTLSFIWESFAVGREGGRYTRKSCYRTEVEDSFKILPQLKKKSIVEGPSNNTTNIAGVG